MSKIIPFPDSTGPTVKDVIDSMTDLQRQVLYHIVGQAWAPKPEAPLFVRYYAQIGYIALNVTHEEFVAIQKLRSDILYNYKLGLLSDTEYRTLYNASRIVMDYMRKELQNGSEKNQDGTDGHDEL